METASLERHFARIGARVRFVDWARTRRRHAIHRVALDVHRERRGEWFEISLPPAAPWDLQILDVRPDLRHLLLMTRDEQGDKHRFLCGHDERHWFVAAIPESAPGVADVPRALESLKPAPIREEQARAGTARANPRDRRTAAFIRQGEWFFVPAPDLDVDPRYILHKERLSRGRGSKPHVVDELFRTGGTTVYVSSNWQGGVDYAEYARLRQQERDRGIRRNWWVQRRDAEVYVRGRVRHPDHHTIRLNVWHRVHMNTESGAQAMSQVVFLD